MCSAESARGEQYCGACGANRIEAITERAQQLAQKLDEARTLGGEHRYLDALALLSTMCEAEHERLQQQASQARQLAEQIGQERDRRQAEAEEAVRRAETRLANYEYHEAIRLLEMVPPPLRSDTARCLLEDARRKRDDVAALTNRIKASLKSGRLIELSAQVHSLLMLKPNHARMRKLAEQLTKRLCRLAKNKLVDHRYSEAVKLLDKAPMAARDAGVDKLRQHAAELEWLMTDLRTAPVIDDALLKVAQRLLKAAPGNEQALQIYRRLQQQAQSAPAELPVAGRGWAPPPERPHVGCPVGWLTGFRRIRVPEASVLSKLKREPGRFHVACGLALQAIGKGPLRLNLAPPQKRSVLGGLKLGLLGPSPRSAWGIDVGDSSLKAIRLVCDNQQQLLADACELIPHERALNQPGAQPEQVAIVRRSLQSLLARHDLTGTRVGVSLSATRVLARLLRLPRSKSKVRSEIVAYEARHVLPFALNELVWDFQPLQPSEGDSPGDEGERVLLLAAKSWDANQRAAAFQDCGLEIDVMQSDTAALHNLMGFELSAAPEGAEAGGAAGLLDVGAAASNLVIACQDVVWFRSIGLGGDDFTQKLVRDLRLTRLQAEQAKREPFRARVISRLYESLQPVSSQLAAELRLSLDAFAKAYPNHRVRAIYGVGGGFQLHGLLRHLQRGF